MSDAKVLDSWALLCYLEQESGFEKIIQVFEEAVNDSQPLWRNNDRPSSIRATLNLNQWKRKLRSAGFRKDKDKDRLGFENRVGLKFG